jgi:O-antigen/teichoic acid export membrane protein
MERVKGIEPSSLSPALAPLIIRDFHMGERPATRRLLLLLLLLLAIPSIPAEESSFGFSGFLVEELRRAQRGR